MPPLESNIQEVPFATGLAQKTDQRHVQDGALTTLVNCSADKSGALRKRYGSTAVSKQSLTSTGNGPALAAGVCVESYQASPVVSDGSSLYSYSAIKNALVYKDQLPECIATRTSISQTTAGVVQMDCAASTNGYALYVFRAAEVGGAVKNYATIIDTKSGAQIGADTILDTSTKAGLRCFALGTDLWALWTDSFGHILGSRFATAGTFQWQAPVSLIGDQSATATFSAWDAAPDSGGLLFYVAYQDNQATNHVHVRKFDTNGSAFVTNDFAVGSGTLPVTAFALKSQSGGSLWLAYSTTDGVNTNYIRSVGFDQTTLAITAADTLAWSESLLGTRHLGIEMSNATTSIIVSSGASDVSWQQRSGAGLVGPKRTQYGYQQFSKPFVVGSQVFCLFFHYGDPTNQTYQLVDLIASDTSSDSARARPVATVGPRLAAPIGSQLSAAYVTSIGNGRYVTPVSIIQSSSRTGVQSASFDFQSPLRHQSVEMGPCVYMAGGVPSVFDGAQATEHGFLAVPTLGNGVVSAGGSVDVGNHQYAVVFKWPNARGEIQRSAPVFSGQIPTTSGNQTVTLTSSVCALTTKQDAGNFWNPAVTFDVYRNTISDPATFWQVAPDSAETISDPRSGTATISLISDTISDATMTGNAYGLLYTLGGVLTEECPSSLTCLCTHKSRLWGVGDDGITLWFTKQYVPGFTPGFNDELTLTVPEDGGAITGLASLDDSLVVFKQDRIFRLYGTGPNDTGQQSDFSSFIATASDTGCTSQRSIVVAQAGVYFMSPKGLCLLTRAGEVVYAGRAVEDIVRANPFCFASDIVAPLEEIRWCLAPSQFSATGVVVTFNYGTDVWSVSQYWDSDQAVASAVVKGAKAPGGNWAWLGAGGQLSIESSSTYLDAGTWVTMQVASAWVKANGILGWGRFREFSALVQQATPFQCAIDWAQDYSDTWLTGDTWSDATIATFSDPVFALSTQPAEQRTSAMRMRFTDAAPVTAGTGTGQGATLVGAQVECGVLRGGAGKRQQSTQNL